MSKSHIFTKTVSCKRHIFDQFQVMEGSWFRNLLGVEEFDHQTWIKAYSALALKFSN